MNLTLEHVFEPDLSWVVQPCPAQERKSFQDAAAGLVEFIKDCSTSVPDAVAMAGNYLAWRSNHGACGDVPQAGGITFHFLFYLAFHQNLTIKLLRSIWHSIWHSVRARRSPDLTIERLFKNRLLRKLLAFWWRYLPVLHCSYWQIFPTPLKVEHAYLIFREKWFHFAHWGGGIIALIIINIIIIVITILTIILTIILAIITSQTVQVLVYLATL